MKKNVCIGAAALVALLLAFGVTGCRKEKKPPELSEPSGSQSSSRPGGSNAGAQSSVSALDSIDYWLDQISSGEKIVMDSGAIADYNRSLTADAATYCVNLTEMSGQVSRQDLTAMLSEIAMPQDERFIGASKATPDYYKNLESNLNKGGIKDQNSVGFGFAVNNTILRTFPTADPSYEFANDLEFDLFAETMLKTWDPVRILHTSADGKWVYIQSRNYRAWAAANDIAACEEAEFSRYAAPESMLVVTGNRITLNENVYNAAASGRELYMGTVLPYLTEAPAAIDGMTAASGRAVLLPMRDAGGKMATIQALVPWNSDVSEGYLAYTQENVLRQGFKLLGDRHGWSGMNKSRDSSSLIQDVFSVFGVSLPRNSAQQAAIPGQKTDLAGLSDGDKTSKILDQPAGSLLTMNDHVALYVGSIDGTPYVLHSIYVAYDESKNEQIYNAIVVTDLSLRERSGETYLTSIQSATQIR